MYNLYIYSNYRTIIFTQISYKDCIANLLKPNVKKDFKLIKVVKL